MAADMNKIILVGNIGRRPKPTEDGATARMLTRRRTDGADGEVRRIASDWHLLVFPEPLSEVALEEVGEGERVHVEGQLRYDWYERADGVTIPVAEVHVTSFVRLAKVEAEGGDSPVLTCDGEQTLMMGPDT